MPSDVHNNYRYLIIVVALSSLGTAVMNLTSSGDYPTLGESITLTCTLTTDNPTNPWPLEIHRSGGSGSDVGCITCNTDNPGGGIGPVCSASTSAHYNVNQCDLKDERTTLVLGITGITEQEIGEWGCYYSYGQEPNAMLTVDKLGNIARSVYIGYHYIIQSGLCIICNAVSLIMRRCIRCTLKPDPTFRARPISYNQ